MSMAGSVRDVTAHLLDDAQPDALSPAQPVQVQQIVQSIAALPSPTPGILAKPSSGPLCLLTVILLTQ